MRKRFQHKKPTVKLNPKNEEIRAPEITLITDTGERIEHVVTRDAIQMARDRDLDLVLIAPTLQPPIAKIMDWGKYKYERTKKDQQQRKSQKAAETKEMRLRPKTDTHDLGIKLKKIREFIQKGHKVKISMMFRGREAMYLDKGRSDVQNFINQLSDIAAPEDRMVYQFKRLSVTMAPGKTTHQIKNHHEAQNAQGSRQENQDNKERKD